ncbi:MAG: C25 family cysteine peptidase, partial [Candidatus Zixiibacteriota bacterium]
MGKLFLTNFWVLLFSVAITSSAFANQSIQLSNINDGVTLLEQDETGLTLKLEIGTLHFTDVWTKEGNFTLMSINGFTKSQRIGDPSLPMINKLISIPYGCKLKVDVIGSVTEEISLTNLSITDPLMPVQPSLSKSDDPMSVPFEYNQTLYQQSGKYTLPLVETSLEGVMRSLRLGMVSIAPVEYNPTKNKIIVHKEIIIQVSYENPDWTTTEINHTKYYSPFFEPVYKGILNYQSQNSTMRDDLVLYPVKYVIISDRMFETQLQPFIEWKTKKGFTVVTAYTDEIGYSNTAIKSYIQNLYNNGTPEDPAPSFVLLVGDAQQIPPFNGVAGSHYTDRNFCEYTNDVFPEIYYGRFSAQNSSQLQPQIDKTLEYEQYLMPDPSYLGEVSLVAGVDASYAPTHGNGQINYGTNLYFNIAHNISPNVWLYPASDAPGASGEIIQSINDGVGFYNYTAHCSHSGHADPSFTTSDIPGLTNYNKYLLGIGNCCLSNTFGIDYSTPCFGEAFLQAVNKGGIGYIGGTNSTYWDEDYWWGVGYGPVIGSGPTYEQTGPGAYDGIFHDHGEPISQHYIANDAIIFAGNMAVTESGSSMENYYWEIYHLMGDPSIMTYVGMPVENIVMHDAAILMTSTSIAVQADPGSYVGISVNGELQGAGYIDISGSADIPLIGFASPGTADIVVSCQNKNPYFSSIQVIKPSGPYVIF